MRDAFGVQTNVRYSGVIEVDAPIGHCRQSATKRPPTKPELAIPAVLSIPQFLRRGGQS
jgi:hypothetical protein